MWLRFSCLKLLNKRRNQREIFYFRSFNITRNYSNQKEIETSSTPSNSSTPSSTDSISNSTSSTSSTTSKIFNFSSYTQLYEDLETKVMKNVRESNKRRFRLIVGSLIFGISWFFWVFGETISKKLRSLTTGLALETLEDKSIKIQTQELAMAVVQTVLNDKQVTAQAASFLREAAHTPETQEALLKLTLHVLQHPDSKKELLILTKHVIDELSKDKVSNNETKKTLFFLII